MINPSKKFCSLLQEIKKINRLVGDLVNSCGKTVIYRCFEIDYRDWSNLSKKHRLKDWIAVPVDSVTEEILSDVILWEMERVKKSSLSMCLALLRPEGKDLPDRSLLLSFIKKLIHITDYVFCYNSKILILFTDSSLFASKQKVNFILKELKKVAPDNEFFVGVVCYKGKKDISSKELIDLTDKALEDAFRSKEKIVIGPILGEEIDTKVQVTSEEKRFLFSL